MQSTVHSETIFDNVLTINDQYYKNFSKLLRMNFDDAVHKFENNTIDLLHIDGLHTYDAVKHDFETWLPKMTHNGVILFHDTNVKKVNFGVWKLWNEIKKEYPNNVEFSHSNGLGVVFLLRDIKKNIDFNWLAGNTEEKNKVINYFAKLGDYQIARYKIKEFEKLLEDGDNNSIDKRVTEIRALNLAAIKRDAHINLLDEKLTQRDAHINLLDEKLTQRDEDIKSIDHKYHNSSIEIQNLKFEKNLLRSELDKHEFFLFFHFIKKISELKNKLSGTTIGCLYRNARSIFSFHKIAKKNIDDIQISILRNRVYGKKLIVVFPIITWSFRWQRPQQLISRFASRGYTIIYIAITLSPIKRLFKSKSDSLQSLRISVLDKDIFKVWLNSFDPLNIYSNQIDGLNFKNLTQQLNAVIEEVFPKDIYYLVHFPSWYPLAYDLKNSFGGKLIFDCMDDHSGFSNTTKIALGEELNLLKKSDLVVVSSDVLQRKFMGLNANTIHIKNGCEFNHFNQSKKNGSLSFLSNKPVIGYYGAIADWFDSDLVLNAARTYPDWNFILIGDTHGAETEGLKLLDNVHFLGEIPYRELPGYFAYFDVCLIPFKIIPLTLATNPVKFYEYLSDGKPVVSTNLPELKIYEKDCYLAQDKNSFITKIREAYDERKDPALIERRLKIAKDNSWDSRVNEFLNNEIFD